MINFISSSNEMIASYRYRVASPMNGLLLEGIHSRVSSHFLLDATTVVYQKHFNACDYPDAIGARGMGMGVIYDICDDHSETIYREHYNRMISVAHALTCNSKAMAERIWNVWGKKAEIIPDPIIYRPLDRTPDLTKFLWFGFQGGIEPLIERLHEVGDRQLEVCTGPMRGFPALPNVTLTHFSPEEQERAFLRNGVAFIPYGGERFETKSANRIIEALNASMVVVTNGIPA